jgi:hypothetical protein
MERAAWPILLPRVGLLAAVLLLLRLPSLLEPTWYADEGTYSDIGRAIDHGAVLYRDVWDNKPPAIYWLTALLELRGPSVPVLHGVLALFVAASTAGVWFLGRRLAGMRGATLAALVFAVLASLPNFDGDLYNAEVLGATFSVFAMLVLLRVHPRHLLAGALIGVAILFKEVFVADLAVAVVVPSILSGRRELRAGALVAAGAGLVLAAAAIPILATGALGGALYVLTFQDLKYVGWSNGIGGGTATLALVVLAVLRLAFPVLAGGGAAWALVRQGRPAAAAVSLWLGFDLAATMLSARGLTHYVQQAEPALALVAAMLAVATLRRVRRFGVPLALGSLLLTWPLAQLVLWVPRAEVALAQGQAAPAWEHNNFPTTGVPRYYANAWGRLDGSLSVQAYNAGFPGGLQTQGAVVDLFQDCSAPGQRVFVWGTVHWAYALSDRLPAGRYVALNPAFSLDPASHELLLQDLAAHPPAVLVATMPPPSDLRAWLERLHYAKAPGRVGGSPYWIAPGGTC